MSTPDKLTTLLHRPSRQPWARLQTRFQTHKERRSLIRTLPEKPQTECEHDHAVARRPHTR
jgi:hypothetical protein